MNIKEFSGLVRLQRHDENDIAKNEQYIIYYYTCGCKNWQMSCAYQEEYPDPYCSLKRAAAIKKLYNKVRRKKNGFKELIKLPEIVENVHQQKAI